MRTITLLLSSALLWSVSWAQQPQQSAPAASPQDKAVAATEKKSPSTAPAAQPEKKETPSAASSELSVAHAVIAAGLDEYKPVKPDTLFPADIKRLYCYSQIKGASDATEIEHRWYWNDELQSAVPLKIKSNDWRTYSIKTIVPGMTGEWRVAVVHPQKDEKVLTTLKFTVK
ncbi:MAG: DUF2914 domain-containing protein [Chitinispirillaceae bacterium]|nr:DUF2914 domain-containing protein [Chitinispirillaceae bacterium]